MGESDESHSRLDLTGSSAAIVHVEKRIVLWYLMKGGRVKNQRRDRYVYALERRVRVEVEGLDALTPRTCVKYT